MQYKSYFGTDTVFRKALPFMESSIHKWIQNAMVRESCIHLWIDVAIYG